jgi:hypothetical protein
LFLSEHVYRHARPMRRTPCDKTTAASLLAEVIQHDKHF